MTEPKNHTRSIRTRAGMVLLGQQVVVHGKDLHHDCLELGFVHYLLFAVTGRTFEPVHVRVLEQLGRIAPEADLAALPDDAPLRDELEIDSMDFLHFATALHDALGVDVPESDYERIASVGGCVDYLAVRLSR